MNLQYYTGNDSGGHSRGSHYARPHYTGNPNGRRRRYRNSESLDGQSWSRDTFAHSSQFVPAPRPSKYAQKTRTQSTRSYLNQIKLIESLAEFKKYPMVHAGPLERPVHGQACKCLPFSGNDLTSKTTTSLGLRNLLRVSTNNSDRYFLTRKCCYVFHCLNLRTKFHYPDIPNKLIIKDECVAAALEQVVADEMEQKGLEASDKKAYVTLLAKYTARANKLLHEMKAALSSTLIRLTGYVLFKVFSNLFSSVTVHGGQKEVIERAAQKDMPIIYLPLHRSHVDYLFVTWILFNQQIPAPIVAAGDNLRMPVFGWLLRGLGGFFIKRRLDAAKSRKDILYRSVLQTYMTHSLQAGYNLEFFIEGGRTRTGKPCMPKGGLLSVIVDAYSNGTLEDALIIPIAINYDRLLDGNFIREQMGQSKVPESFWGAVRAIIKGARSSSSLFGTEVTEEYRLLVKSLAVHIVFDAERCQAIMSTNAVAWLLSFVYRSGTRLSTLTTALDALRDSLKARKRDTGFSGDSREVVRHAVQLLGPGLVRTEDFSGSNSSACDKPDYFIEPVTLLPNIIEFNYYASALGPLFAADAIVVTTLLSMTDCDLWTYKDCSPDCLVDKKKLLQRAGRLASVLQHEYLLAPPCAKQEDRLSQALDNLVDMGLLQAAVFPQKGVRRWSDDSDEDDISYCHHFKVTPTSSSLEVIGAWRNMLVPMLDAYYYTAHCLQKLIATQMPDKEFIQSSQSYIGSLLEKGILKYGESICIDPIRNAVKFFESEGVVESYTHDSIRLLYLSKEFESEDKLLPFINEIDSFRS
ncbi:hypothetical protein O3P69_017038 [Scylla paramamosain]|uniref:Phospholipid/glycerol acyltransferase domain-containing protein n=1 Tax=Scylla paramamosain TaxID=85552 RepID=A0AAW0TU02_SCYPA